jgi:hypothetical protein
VLNATGRTNQQLVEEVTRRAVDRAINIGAQKESVEVVEVDTIPVQVCKSSRIRVVKR